MEHFIGIDVSKATLDLALMDASGQLLAMIQTENNAKGLARSWRRWSKEFGLVKDDCLVCLEPTAPISRKTSTPVYRNSPGSSATTPKNLRSITPWK